MEFHRQSKKTTMFIVNCDVDMFGFCLESFEYYDVHVLQHSTSKFDFALMASCNGTIISNENGALHALINLGKATVHRHAATAGASSESISLSMSDILPNWHVIVA